MEALPSHHEEHEYLQMIRRTIAHAHERIQKEQKVEIKSFEPQESYVQSNPWLSSFITDLTTIYTNIEIGLEDVDSMTSREKELFLQLKEKIAPLMKRIEEVKKDYPPTSGVDNIPEEIKTELLNDLHILDDHSEMR